MIITLEEQISMAEAEIIKGMVEGMSGPAALIDDGGLVISAQGDDDKREVAATIPGVASVQEISTPYKLVSPDYRSQRHVQVGDVQIGKDLVFIAGPCAVESLPQLAQTGIDVRNAGAQLLRGGAYKPRTNMYSFQGLEELGLKYLTMVKDETGMPIVTELMDKEDIPLFQQYGVDVVQIGARNAQNFRLLKAVGEAYAGTDTAILYKRGPAMSISEFINGAEYIVGNGTPNVILCVRGTKKLPGEETRNHYDFGDIKELSQKCNLPIVVDPSHMAGDRELIEGIVMQAMDAGANAFMIEAHHKPEYALCDGPQMVYSNGNGTPGLKQIISTAKQKYLH